MRDWSITLKDKQLNELFGNYIYHQKQTLTFYLSSHVLSDFTEFPEASLDHEVRASYNFDDCATSVAKVGDVKLLIDSGHFQQQARSLSIIALLTSFGDFFDDLRSVLEIKGHEAKEAFIVETAGRTVKIRPACLKTACFISKKYNVSSPLTEKEAILWINCWISLRHMFMHSRGKFSDEYANNMMRKWRDLNHGDPILFDINEVDSIYWFLNSHLRAFVVNFDKALARSP